MIADFAVTQADDFFSPSVQIDNPIFVPEPGTCLLVAGGLMLLSVARASLILQS